MAELPSTPLSLVTSEAPKSAVSPGQVAAPFAELGQSLEKVGEGLGQIAEPFAEQAGYKAVSRDENGNLTYQHAPIIGPAGAAFARAAKFTALAEASGDARRDDIAMSKQFLDNPDGYAAAAAKYRDTMVQKYSQVSPEVGAIIGKQIDSQTTFNYRFLQNQHQRLVAENFSRSTKAELESNTEDLLSLLRSNPDENSPQAKRLLTNIVALTHERVANPVMAYPQTQAAHDLKSLDLQIGAAKVLNTIDGIMKDPNRGAIDAMDEVDKIKGGVGDYAKLTPLQRQFYAQEAEKTIRSTSQDDSRRANINAKQQKARDETFEDSVIKDSATAQPMITADDIKTMQGVSPESKMRMLAWQHRQGAGEPLSQLSHTTSVDLFRRMNLPDGDPNKLTDLNSVREAYAPLDGSPSKLNRQDEEWLEKRFNESRTATGEHLNTTRKEFGDAIKPLLDRSTISNLDETGKLRNYQFERYVQQRIDEYRQTPGKNAFDLFDPTKPDYLGKPEIIQQFQTTAQRRAADISKKLGEGVPPMPTPPPPPSGGVRGASNAATPGSIWGNPGSPNFESEHLTTVQTPSGLSAQVNRVAAPAFSGFLRELEQSGYKIDSVEGYNPRHIAGTAMLSQHAYGNAIDINPNRNPVGFGITKTDLPPNVGEMAAKYGISWGGEWKNKKDPMHFEFVGQGKAAQANDLLRQAGESFSQYLSRVSGRL